MRFGFFLTGMGLIHGELDKTHSGIFYEIQMKSVELTPELFELAKEARERIQRDFGHLEFGESLLCILDFAIAQYEENQKKGYCKEPDCNGH